MSRFPRLVILSLTVLLAIGIVVLVMLRPPGQTGQNALTPVTTDAFGGPFSLLDQDGKDFTEKSFDKKYRLIYFGFTYCPAICPTELGKIARAMKSLGPDVDMIHPYFVTVDPERDTPAKMKPYVAMFDPRLTGLTGTPDNVKAMLKEYKVYAAKVEDPALTEYTMDHSSFIYFMAPDGRLLQIFKNDDTAEQMASAISQWLAQENAKN